MINIGIYPNLESTNEDINSINEFLVLQGNSVLNSIIKNRKIITERDVLKNCQNSLVLDYKNYENYKYHLQDVVHDSSLTTETEDLLRKLYDGKKPVGLQKALRKIEELLPDNLYGMCPYCRIAPYDTYDHYLCKGSYPEFSVYPLNLIPCCSKCNSLKGSELLNDSGERVFLNMRFDALPDYPFLKCILGCNNSIYFIKRFEVSLNCNEPMSNIIHLHFDKLQLDRRIRNKAQGTLDEIIELSKRNYDASVLRNKLQERLELLESIYGVNYWDACVYRAVLSCDDFWENAHS